MAKAQLKILAFLITVGLVAGSLSVGWWFYTNVLLKESQVEQDIASMKGKDRPKIDPGARRFDAAIELIKAGKIEEGRDDLSKLCLQFPESATCPEAMRIIGEINMDMLYSSNNKMGKKDYIVQPGNTLLGIATKHDTTIDSIVRMNGLMSTMLQPGDHLTLIPMDFHLLVDVSSKEVILQRKVGEKKYPFKFYLAKELRLPPGTRVPLETELAGKNASIDGKTVLSTDPNYAAAEKWISARKPGIVIRTPPEPHAPKALPVEAAPGSKKEKGKKTSKTAAKGAPPEAMPPPPPSMESETGIFLAREDIEEIFALVRTGSTLSIKR
ncbi:MAG: LysM peptidoglycan-binding domain-containing protein [Prosthecobacter sp.]